MTAAPPSRPPAASAVRPGPAHPSGPPSRPPALGNATWNAPEQHATTPDASDASGTTGTSGADDPDDPETHGNGCGADARTRKIAETDGKTANDPGDDSDTRERCRAGSHNDAAAEKPPENTTGAPVHPGNPRERSGNAPNTYYTINISITYVVDSNKIYFSNL